MSALRNAAHEYLQVRRALGFKLRQQGRMLLQFVDFLDQRGAAVITTELALEWARQPGGGSQMWWHQRLAVVRAFAQHLAALIRAPRCHPATCCQRALIARFPTSTPMPRSRG